MRVNGPKEAVEDGYAVAYMQIYCGEWQRSGHGLNIFAKAIRGDEAAYLIRREVGAPKSSVGGVVSFSEKEMEQLKAMMEAQGEANAHLVEGVYICGSRSVATRCTTTP